MVVGRFEDGTPVATDTKANGERENDFAYSIDDPNGNKCPFSAHIRLVNGRGSSVKEKAHRIARRGITYGVPAPWGEDLDALPEKGVGLLFQCCQADLANQFEFLQKASGVNDPVTGQSPDGLAPEMQFPSPWGSHGRKRCAFNGFVTMMGGEYFLLRPASISWSGLHRKAIDAGRLPPACCAGVHATGSAGRCWGRCGWHGARGRSSRRALPRPETARRRRRSADRWRSRSPAVPRPAG